MVQKSLLSLVLIAVLACGRTHVARADWLHLNPEEKRLYVLSLIGRETAKERKGGGGRVYRRPAEEYVRQIDEAYAHGDRRDVDQIFADMGSPR